MTNADIELIRTNMQRIEAIADEVGWDREMAMVHAALQNALAKHEAGLVKLDANRELVRS